MTPLTVSTTSNDASSASRLSRTNQVRRIVARLLQISPFGILTCAALAPVAWMIAQLPIKGVDSMFSLHPQGRIYTTLFSAAWDARVSAGEPADGHIWVVFNLVQGALSAMGLPLNIVEMLVMVALSSAAVAGSYKLAMAVSPQEASLLVRRFAAGCAAVVWVANPFDLTFVWAKQLATELTIAATPWLFLLMLQAVRGQRPATKYVPLTVVVSILGSAGLPLFYLPAVFMLLGITAAVLIWAAPRRGTALSGAALFFAAFVGSTLWWLIPSLFSLSTIYANATFNQSSVGIFSYESSRASIANILSLTAIPQLYDGIGGVPYISWAAWITSGPGYVLRFMLPATAVIGIAWGWRIKSERVMVVAAALCVVVAVSLSKGSNPPFADFNRLLLDLPFGYSLRHPVDKFSMLLVLPLCILFAFGLTALLRDPYTRIPGAIVAIVVCVVMAFPWWTGSVIPVGGGVIPSARVDIPSSYEIVGIDLSKSPIGGKTMVLPYAADQQSAYLWRSGIQPNEDCLLQDWAPQRTLICDGTGYGFANRVGDTVADAVVNRDPRVFELSRLWGIDRWLVHQDWEAGYFSTPTPPALANAFLENPFTGAEATPTKRSGGILQIPSTARAMTVHVRVSEAPTSVADRLLRIGSVYLEINLDTSSGKIFFSLTDLQRHIWDPGIPTFINQWHTITLRFNLGRIFLSVDGVDESGVLQCGPLGGPSCTTPIGSGVQLNEPLTSVQVLTQQLGSGKSEISRPDFQSSDPRTDQGEQSPLTLTRSTAELRLWSQAALPVLYAARSVAYVDGPFSGEQLLSAAHSVSQDADPVILGNSGQHFNLDPSASTSLTIINPTDMRGVLNVHGTSVLVFSQSFGEGWSLNVNGRTMPESAHVVTNGFANGWALSGNGDVPWELTYVPELRVLIAYIVGLLAFLGSVVMLVAGHRGSSRLRWRHRSAQE